MQAQSSSCAPRLYASTAAAPSPTSVWRSPRRDNTLRITACDSGSSSATRICAAFGDGRTDGGVTGGAGDAVGDGGGSSGGGRRAARGAANAGTPSALPPVTATASSDSCFRAESSLMPLLAALSGSASAHAPSSGASAALTAAPLLTATSPGGSHSGMVNVMVVPLPIPSLAAVRSPPIARAILRQICASKGEECMSENGTSQLIRRC